MFIAAWCCNLMRAPAQPFRARLRTTEQIGRQNVGTLAYIKKLLYLCIGFKIRFFMVFIWFGIPAQGCAGISLCHFVGVSKMVI